MNTHNRLLSTLLLGFILVTINAGCEVQLKTQEAAADNTEAAPLAIAPTIAPPTVAPPTVAPPTVAPPTIAPPTIAPPTISPPTIAPPTIAPPTVAPPTIAPPTASETPVSQYDQLPIVDTHVHYSQDAWSAFSAAEIIEKFAQSDVGRAVVSSSPDEGTRQLYALAPEIIIPFLRPYHDDAGSSNWYLSEGIYEYLQSRLVTHPYSGIGEFHLHSSANIELESVQNTIREAVVRNIYLFIHADAASVEAVFNFEPNVKIFWAHAGMSEPPEVVSAMMDKHTNLWTDLSYREYQVIAPTGQIAPEWMALFLRHPDRITIGSDTWVTARWRGYEAIIAQHRIYLEQLPIEIAEQVAYRNALRLFGGAPLD